GREQCGGGACGLSWPDQEESARAQGIVERRKHALLQRWLEVDEEIPTADEVDARVRRVVHQVVVGEDANVADRLHDLIAVAHLREEALETLWGDVAHAVRRVPSGPRRCERVLAEVRSEDLQSGVLRRRPSLEEAHRN